MENNNNLIRNDNPIIVPANAEVLPARTLSRRENQLDKSAGDTLKLLVDSAKEGLSTHRDDRIREKKILDAQIGTAERNLGIQQVEYERVSKKLQQKDLSEDERRSAERRAEVLSDRIHRTSTVHRTDLIESQPPKKEKKMPWWGWVLVGLGIGGGFCGGCHYESRKHRN